MPYFFWLFGLLVIGGAAAQDKPDFTGRWLLVNSTDAGSHAQALTIRQDAGQPLSELVVERRVGADVRTERHRIGVVGGTVGGVKPGSTGDVLNTRYEVKWEGNRLVIVTSGSTGSAESKRYTEHREVWSLDERGRLIMTVTDRKTGEEPTMTTLTYERRPAERLSEFPLLVGRK